MVTAFYIFIYLFLHLNNIISKIRKKGTQRGQFMDKTWTKYGHVPVKKSGPLMPKNQKSRLYQDTSSFPCLGYPSYFDTI